MMTNPTRLFLDFFNSEKTGGLLLICCTLISLITANSSLGENYLHFWNLDIGGHPFYHWINDGLMVIFFLLIGLELEREIYIGELSDIRSASLPMVGAIGGMVIPAVLYMSLNLNTLTQSGAGIPMATDIAFAIGILSLLGSRVPLSLKVFLTALAVIDDLGAILVIAFFYTSAISWLNLVLALVVFGLLLIFNRMRIYNLIPYIIGGILMWYFMLNSGVHATITGVLLAFAIPFGDGGEKSPSARLQHFLHRPVAFIILPLFALANTGIILNHHWYESLGNTGSLGIFAGLIIGKPLGITLFSFIGVILGLCTLPSDLKWSHIIGAGFLGGIGFTMSIFITILAYSDQTFIAESKIAVLLASAVAGVTGYFLLRRFLVKE